jgi:hypothetical protein
MSTGLTAREREREGEAEEAWLSHVLYKQRDGIIFNQLRNFTSATAAAPSSAAGSSA